MKKTLALLLLTALLITPLSGCNTTDENKPDDTVATTDNVPEYNAADANPASDFEYKVGEDGGITITKYIGTDSDVVIPEKIDGKNVTVIGEKSFHENNILISVAIPDSVTRIGRSAFVYCKNLTTVRLSDCLEVISAGAFDSCGNLSNIRLPKTVRLLGERAFAGCKSLKNISIPANCYRNNNPDEYASLMYAFAYSGLESVEFQEGVQFIPSYTFTQTNLKEVIIPASVERIASYAFAGCKNLNQITLNEGLTSIGANAFESTNVSEITIPSTVIDMKISAFNQMSQLTKVYFKGNAPDNFTANTTPPSFTIYYHEGAEGFTSPEWNGYKTEIW